MRGGQRPTWQSREGTYSSCKVSTKTHQPIASVAALSERHAGWQYWWHEFNGAMLPDLSLRGPEGAVAISGKQLCFRRSFRDIQHSTARLPRRFAPRNDKSGAFAILTAVCTDYKCAAGPGCPLPYNGWCGSAVPSRDRHGRGAPRNDTSGAISRFRIPHSPLNSLQYGRSSHRPQCGLRAVHTRRPCQISQ